MIRLPSRQPRVVLETPNETALRLDCQSHLFAKMHQSGRRLQADNVGVFSYRSARFISLDENVIEATQVKGPQTRRRYPRLIFADRKM